jgi:hypothetical protein
MLSFAAVLALEIPDLELSVVHRALPPASSLHARASVSFSGVPRNDLLRQRQCLIFRRTAQ